jgi:hypothetical protein
MILGMIDINAKVLILCKAKYYNLAEIFEDSRADVLILLKIKSGI